MTLLTYDTTYVCTDPGCLEYVPINGYSMEPDTPPLVIDSACPACGKQFRFSIDGSGGLSTEEL